MVLPVLVAGEGSAEIEIVLKDGKVYRLPVPGADIDSILLDGERVYPGPKVGQAESGPEQERPAAAAPQPAIGRIVQVGPGRRFQTPRQAMRNVRDGDTIEIDAGSYPGDVAVWKANNITLRGVGGFVQLDARGQAAQGKAIWVIQGNNVTVENIEFANAKVKDRNGAGIRIEGANLTIRNCVFRDNQNGVLGGGKHPDSVILIENSIFARNGYGDGQSHGLYIGGRIKRLILRNNYIYHTKIGHQVKSRARENFILYNKIVDQETGSSSYAIDITGGRLAVVTGNVFHQGEQTDNNALIHFEAKNAHPDGGIYLVNNTAVNERRNGIFLRNRSPVEAVILNNVFFGDLLPAKGKAKEVGTVWARLDDFVDPSSYDYRLRDGAAAIDAAVDPEIVEGDYLLPLYEYVHSADGKERPRIGPLDAGAFEFVPRQD